VMLLSGPASIARQALERSNAEHLAGRTIS
jgi:hypothetical protein